MVSNSSTKKPVCKSCGIYIYNKPAVSCNNSVHTEKFNYMSEYKKNYHFNNKEKRLCVSCGNNLDGKQLDGCNNENHLKRYSNKMNGGKCKSCNIYMEKKPLSICTNEKHINRYKDKCEHQKEYRKANPELMHIYSVNHRKYHKEYYYKHMYGITLNEVKSMYEEQGGVCPICGKELGEDYVVDHNHETEEVRALLHNKCNLLIGYVETLGASDELFDNVRSYLMKQVGV